MTTPNEQSDVSEVPSTSVRGTNRSMDWHRSAKKVAWLVTLVGGSFLALAGAAHTPYGRPLLALFPVVPGCPVSLDAVDPVRAEDFRRKKMEEQAGARRATEFPAARFELGKSRTVVEAELEKSQVECERKRSGSVLVCARMNETGRPDLEELHLQFDGSNRLVAVDFFRQVGCGAEALRHLKMREEDLARRVGPPTERHGAARSEYLDSGRYRRVASEFKYANYSAELSAMNYGERGIRVRETYQWLPG